jgi:pullulanase/glycogen debranching enzyme
LSAARLLACAAAACAGRRRAQSHADGNNNPYCQDNPISWLDWRLDDSGRELLEFTRQMIRIRKALPVLHRRSFFQDRSIHGPEVRDIEWFRPNGQEMTEDEWSHSFVRCLGMLLNGQVMDEWGERGVRLLTLTGPDGTGKTRLAWQAAQRLEPRFPDGVALVNLAPIRDPDLVLPTLADALGCARAASPRCWRACSW